MVSRVSELLMVCAVDQSFVETTSGPAAREIRIRYDRLYAASNEHQSLKFVVTSLVNQYGKQVYRVR